MSAGKLIRNVEAKTADYTLTANDWGKFFTNRGAAGAVTFTLPTAASTAPGFYADFFVVANQNVIVAGTAGEVVAFNDATANSVAFSTADEKVGGGLRAVCDGTSWLMFVYLGAETQTPTVAT